MPVEYSHLAEKAKQSRDRGELRRADCLPALQNGSFCVSTSMPTRERLVAGFTQQFELHTNMSAIVCFPPSSFLGRGMLPIQHQPRIAAKQLTLSQPQEHVLYPRLHQRLGLDIETNSFDQVNTQPR